MKKLICCALLLAAVLPLAAQTTEVTKNFQERLATFSERNRTIRCHFTQTKKVKGLKKVVESEGRFYYDHDGRMALIYTQPAGDKILMTGERFTILTGGRRMVSAAQSNPMLGQLSNMMKACMTGQVTQLGRGWKSEITQETGAYCVVLRPVDARTRRYLSDITLRFDSSDMSLNEMQVNETSGGYTHYKFDDKEFNKEIDPAVFKE